jgi:outer membrane protein assembly factor BamB
VDDLLFIVSDGGVATCLAAKTGEVHWQERMDGDYSASPLLADGKVYFLNEEGLTTVIEPAKEFKVLATNQLEGRTLASLAPLDGAMLFRTDTHLYRLEEPAAGK